MAETKPERAARAKARRAAGASKKAARKEGKAGLERGMDDFAEEVGRLGESFGRHCEEKGDKVESWAHSTFGVVGPFLSSIGGLLILAVFVWVLSVINAPIGSGLISNMQYFLLAHISWFFLIFLFFSYTSYISKRARHTYRLFSPLVTAVGITVALWLFANAIRAVNVSISSEPLSALASFLDSSLMLFFYLFAFLGYLFLLLMVMAGKWKVAAAEKPDAPRKPERPQKHPRPERTDRLYRSGSERILGGVCGGIAEYLGVDPVLIRFVWVIGTLASWGTGILLYIIMWIIMPRNPAHKWEK